MINSVMPTSMMTNLRYRIPSIEITRNHALMAVLLCNMMYFGYFIVHDLVIDAKFWYDELFTVGNALKPLPEMLSLVLGDNHPPLYPVFIHFWMQLAPKDEFAARLPSMIFAIGSVWAIWQLNKTSLPRVMVMIAMVLLTSHHLWAYYAHEARGYALLLFLATAVVVLYLRHKPMPLILLGATMGLVHFFGTLFASLFFAVLFFTPRQSLRIRVAAVIAQVIVSIYPFYHLFLGAASEQIGGNFWMETGPVDTVVTGFMSAFPWYAQSVSTVLSAFDLDSVAQVQDTLTNEAILARSLPVGVAIIIFLFLIRGYKLFRANYTCVERDMRMRLAVIGAISLTVVGTIAILALHTPMGETRNFIVLVPIGSLLGAWFIYTFFIGSRVNAAVGIVALTLLSITSASVTSTRLNARAEVTADQRRWSIELYNQVVSTTGNLYYIPNTLKYLASHLSKGEEAMFNYYMPEEIDFIPITQAQILDLPRGSTVAFWFSECIELNHEDINKSVNAVTAYLDDNGINYTFRILETSLPCVTGYVVLN